jgi:hypothetical protein
MCVSDIYFDDLGIDRLFVDEAHAYKALAIVTKMGNIAGIPGLKDVIEFFRKTGNWEETSVMFGRARCAYVRGRIRALGRTA